MTTLDAGARPEADTAQIDTAQIDTAQIDTARWNEPAGLNPRGTLVLLTGRGEPPEVYARFGRRLAADAYRVVVVSAADHTAAPGVRAEIAALLDAPETVAPVVLVGSDAGARAALVLAADPALDVSGLVLAGLAVETSATGADWPAEIEARTACPNHQQVLRRSARGSLATAVPLLRLAAPVTVGVPVLAVHGRDDTLSPLPTALDWYRRAGIGEVVVVQGGRHDILNDVTHRSVAATVVLFLERLRLGAGLPPLLRTTSTGPA